jgi:hypothetical protein
MPAAASASCACGAARHRRSPYSQQASVTAVEAEAAPVVAL